MKSKQTQSAKAGSSGNPAKPGAEENAQISESTAKKQTRIKAATSKSTPDKRQTQARARAKPDKKARINQNTSSKNNLSFQHRLFVAEFVKDRHATNAAIRAGYSAKTAYAIANKLLKKAEINQAIEEFVAKAEEKAGLTVERTLREIARLAYFDPRKLLNADGSPKAITDLDEDTAAGLAGLEIAEIFEGSGDERVFVGYAKKYKIADKNAALEKAMKHLGLYEKDNTQKPQTDVNVTTRVVLVPAKATADVTVRKLDKGG